LNEGERLYSSIQSIGKKIFEVVYVEQPLQGPLIKYLVIHTESASSFKCSLDAAKRSFYRSFNAIFGKV